MDRITDQSRRDYKRKTKRQRIKQEKIFPWRWRKPDYTKVICWRCKKEVLFTEATYDLEGERWCNHNCMANLTHRFFKRR